MSAQYQIGRYQRLMAISVPLTPSEKLDRLRYEVRTATNDEDRRDWERVVERHLARHPEVAA